MEAFGLVCLYGFTAYDDFRTRQIKLLEIIVFAVIGVLINIVNAKYSFVSIIGGVAVGAAILVFSILSKEKIGKGDALIVMVSGLYLGFMNTLVLVWLSSILAAATGVVVIRKYDNGTNRELPFVPFILLAYLIMVAVGGLKGCL